MTQEQLESALKRMASSIRNAEANARTKTEEEFAELLLLGLDLLGSYLVDIKRIADSLERSEP